jgi:protein-disulfide isomerase
MIRFLLLSLFVALAASPAHAAPLTSGSLIKASGPAVYYYADNGKRYVFPTEKVYKSWYTDFSGIVTITDAELASLTIGGNVTYRPGVRLVKITTDPRVYAVHGTSLRWVNSETVAKTIFGDDWAKQVDDIPDALFTNYTLGENVYEPTDFIASDIRATYATIQQTLIPLSSVNPPSSGTLGTAPVTPVDTARDHIRGNVNAKITLIEYGDFQCPYCLRYSATLKSIQEKFPKDVRVTYRHFPLSFHREAQMAAEASECASEQGKFWEMHDRIFAAQETRTMSVQTWKTVAADLGLDTTAFNTCLDGRAMNTRVVQDIADGNASGVSGTPASFINGKKIEGAIPLEELELYLRKLGATN